MASSNSHPSAISCRAGVERTGVDTWSPGWYLGDSTPCERFLRERATVRAARGSMLLPESILGHRVGWFPGTRLVFAEGHPGGDDLCPASRLPSAYTALREALAAADVDVPDEPQRFARSGSPGFAGIRRLDVTADLRFEDADAGLASLRALSSIALDRSKTVTTSYRGHVETVAWHGYSGGRMMGRAYDKGVESGTAPRGELIRLEDQRRFQATRRRQLEDLGPAQVHDLFRRRYKPLLAAGTVTLGDVNVMGERLAELVNEGRVTPRKAQRLLGAIAFAGLGTDDVRLPRRTYYRRRSELRELGLLLVVGQRERRDVELRRIFEAALGDGAWEKLEREATA